MQLDMTEKASRLAVGFVADSTGFTSHPLVGAALGVRTHKGPF